MNIQSATPLLRAIVGIAPLQTTHPFDAKSTADWLEKWEIGPLAFRKLKASWPEIAQYLQADAYAALSHNTLHHAILKEVVTTLTANNIPVVLLKGAATASVFGGEDWRTMSDIDVWIAPEHGVKAVALLEKTSLSAVPLEPGTIHPTMPAISTSGKRSFVYSGWQHGLVELHIEPFAGLWLDALANVDSDAIWQRRTPATIADLAVQRPAVEDLLIHAAVHLSINHQFDATTLRSLMDIALLIQEGEIDWPLLVARVKAWRLTTAVWLVLHQLAQLLHIELVEPLEALAPAGWRQRTLSQFISIDTLFSPHAWHHNRRRLLYLALLTDRPLALPRFAFQMLQSRP